MTRIEHKAELIAVIISRSFKKDGIEFFTPEELSQQLAYMNRPKGYQIAPHTHNQVERYIVNTLETLFIRSGRVKVDLYDRHQEFVREVVLVEGDIILLVSGGHGFTMLEQSEIIEVKQGPFLGADDKIKFRGRNE
jgi:mannose-6-phosphate isomerase-like protein (cupin superfamily)